MNDTQDGSLFERKISRRELFGWGLAGLAGAGLVGSLGWHVTRSLMQEWPADVFKNDAPGEELWALWQKRGWVKEARHYVRIGSTNVQCKVCPNDCLLEPNDRSRCRNKVNKDGTLYTMAYGNPCSFHIDPIEKKPFFHFLPATTAFSLATSGCGFRCLNCQNWEISQKKPEETKDPRGDSFRLEPQRLASLTFSDVARLSMFPEDVVTLTEHFRCQSIAYTYSEPTSFYEYMIDTAKRARERRIRNVWVTCGYINEEPLLELCRYLDAATVDIKSFSEASYRKLNSGKLQPILDTFKTLKKQNVWFEISTLVVPTYTDSLDGIARMSDWIAENLGPDYPLHLLRFHPAHKLENLPPTPVGVLTDAREVARRAGLHYVYIGNVPEIADAETTFCPNCKKAVVEREFYIIRKITMKDGNCAHCGTTIAGVWAAPS